MLTIDGSQGEGGGQILRTALALSLVSGRAFTIENIRAGREKPGLLRQHLTAVEAARQIGSATVEGAALRSSKLVFHPGEVIPGDYYFAVGTAGSATLVLQTVLPPLLAAKGPSRLTLEGGTHNPFAPPFDFLQKTFLPLVSRMGGQVTATLDVPGFFPAGGGRLRVEIAPGGWASRPPQAGPEAHSPIVLRPLHLLERGPIRRKIARALVSKLPRHIAERELAVIERKLPCDECRVEEIRHSPGPGNVVLIEMESDSLTEVVTAFGQRGTPAERVAATAVDAAQAYLTAGVPVGEHLADQLLIPLALADGGAFVTTTPTPHTRTNAKVIGLFLEIEVAFEPLAAEIFRVTVRRSGGA